MASRTNRTVSRRSTARLMTAEELLDLSIPDKCTELVRGRLIVSEPPKFRHGDTAARILIALGNHAFATKSGRVVAAETGFTLFRNPDTVRGPDVAYISAVRLPPPGFDGFPEFAPDIAVEVLSPGDRRGKIADKISDWITAGAALVWVVDPQRRLARVYRQDGTESQLGPDDALQGEDVLPGFSVRLGEMFD